MPPAVAVPIALAGASMIATNVGNKAANANNLNQQAGEVNNAVSASNAAKTSMAPWLQNAPTGTTGTPTPTTAAPQPAATGVNAASLIQAPQPQGNQMIAQIIKQVLAQPAQRSPQ